MKRGELTVRGDEGSLDAAQVFASWLDSGGRSHAVDGEHSLECSGMRGWCTYAKPWPMPSISSLSPLASWKARVKKRAETALRRLLSTWQVPSPCHRRRTSIPCSLPDSDCRNCREVPKEDTVCWGQASLFGWAKSVVRFPEMPLNAFEGAIPCTMDRLQQSHGAQEMVRALCIMRVLLITKQRQEACRD